MTLSDRDDVDNLIYLELTIVVVVVVVVEILLEGMSCILDHDRWGVAVVLAIVQIFYIYTRLNTRVFYYL
jgi:hypothetical protein